MKKILLLFLILSSCSLAKKKYQKIPSINLLMIDSTTVFNTKDIPKGRPFMLIYFSPDCKECQNETERILQNINELKDTKLYFITNDPLSRLKTFDKHYKLKNYSNIILGNDYEMAFPKKFQTTGTPYSLIYDKGKQLRGVFSGETDTQLILEMLQKLNSES